MHADGEAALDQCRAARPILGRRGFLRCRAVFECARRNHRQQRRRRAIGERVPEVGVVQAGRVRGVHLQGDQFAFMQGEAVGQGG